MSITQRDAFPLTWPDGHAVTPRGRRGRAAFKSTLGGARDHLLNELRLLGTKRVIISSNIPVRQDGYPYASWRQPDEPGVAVYFQQRIVSPNGTVSWAERAIACDRWDRVEANMRALGKTVEALRGIARWGSTDIVDRAFRGFAALPPDPSTDWRLTLGFAADARPGLGAVRSAHRSLARTHHPDMPSGNEEQMRRLNAALHAAEAELGGRA